MAARTVPPTKVSNAVQSCHRGGARVHHRPWSAGTRAPVDRARPASCGYGAGPSM